MRSLPLKANQLPIFRESEFIVTGRGGLPPNPGDTLSAEAVLADWATLDPEVEDRSGAARYNNPTRRVATAIVEAQGWAIGPKGEVSLIASAPTVTPYSSGLTPAECHAIMRRVQPATSGS